MAVAGASLLILRAVASVAGVDAWVSVISGTPPAGVSMETAAVGAAALVLLQLGAVLVAPVLLLSAAMLTLHDGSAHNASRGVVARSPDDGAQRPAPSA